VAWLEIHDEDGFWPSKAYPQSGTLFSSGQTHTTIVVLFDNEWAVEYRPLRKKGMQRRTAQTFGQL